MDNVKWILCPKCSAKTRVKIHSSTKLQNFLLYCHKCKTEFVINVENFDITIVKIIKWNIN